MKLFCEKILKLLTDTKANTFEYGYIKFIEARNARQYDKLFTDYFKSSEYLAQDSFDHLSLAINEGHIKIHLQTCVMSILSQILDDNLEKIKQNVPWLSNEQLTQDDINKLAQGIARAYIMSCKDLIITQYGQETYDNLLEQTNSINIGSIKQQAIDDIKEAKEAHADEYMTSTISQFANELSTLDYMLTGKKLLDDDINEIQDLFNSSLNNPHELAIIIGLIKNNTFLTGYPATFTDEQTNKLDVLQLNNRLSYKEFIKIIDSLTSINERTRGFLTAENAEIIKQKINTMELSEGVISRIKNLLGNKLTDNDIKNIRIICLQNKLTDEHLDNITNLFRNNQLSNQDKENLLAIFKKSSLRQSDQIRIEQIYNNPHNFASLPASKMCEIAASYQQENNAFLIEVNRLYEFNNTLLQQITAARDDVTIGKEGLDKVNQALTDIENTQKILLDTIRRRDIRTLQELLVEKKTICTAYQEQERSINNNLVENQYPFWKNLGKIILNKLKEAFGKGPLAIFKLETLKKDILTRHSKFRNSLENLKSSEEKSQQTKGESGPAV